MRHELKHKITCEDFYVISSRLRHLFPKDAHAGEKGSYSIHSLYFDNADDKVLREKTEGTDRREKFRIRYYNEDTSYIRLEKKTKIHGMCAKESCPLTKSQVEEICRGETGFLLESGFQLCRELYAKMRYQLLRPRCIVDYDRVPYVYAPGNVRITFDSNIRTGLYHNSLFDREYAAVPAEEGTIILEVKYDAFLPEIVRQAVGVPNRMASSYSKYAACRIYG